MAIRAFDLGSQKGLVRAAADGLGNLVVFAGPNGAGKSTLLDLLRQQRWSLAEPGTKVMFVGPHRTWRSSALNRVALYGFAMESYGALLQSDTLPNFQYGVPLGMQGLQGTIRQSGSAEDAPAFVKTSLARLRERQTSLVASTWEAGDGAISAGEVPQLFKPFKELIQTLLPHLEWLRVDDSSPENIRVVFRLIDNPAVEFDIDELSSGEKAAIALLLPLVELQAEQLTSGVPATGDIVPGDNAPR